VSATGRTHTELMALRDTMLHTLQEAAKHRDQRPDPIGDELGWVVYEREQMATAINAARTNRGLGPVTLKDVARVEQQACGHVDYASKYALYCAEMAIGIDKPKP